MVQEIKQGGQGQSSVCGQGRSGHPLWFHIIRQELVHLWREHTSCAHRLIGLMRELSTSCDFFSQNGQQGQLNFPFPGKKQGTAVFCFILEADLSGKVKLQCHLAICHKKLLLPDLQVLNSCASWKFVSSNQGPQKIVCQSCAHWLGPSSSFLSESNSILLTIQWTICNCPVHFWISLGILLWDLICIDRRRLASVLAPEVKICSSDQQPSGTIP